LNSFNIYNFFNIKKLKNEFNKINRMGIGCCNNTLDYPSFVLSTEKKEGLDVYSNRYFIIYKNSLNYFGCPFCSQYFNEEEKEKLKPIFDSFVNVNPTVYKELNDEYNNLIKSQEIDIFPQLESIGKQFEQGKYIIEKYQYLKYTCISDNNKQCYLKLYTGNIPKIIVDKDLDQRYQYDNWKNNEEIKKDLYDMRDSEIYQQELCEKIKEEWELEQINKSKFTHKDLEYFARSQVNCIPYFVGSPSQLTTVFNYVSYSHDLNYAEKKLLKEIVASYAGSGNDRRTFMYMEENEVKMTSKDNKDFLNFLNDYEAKLVH